MGKKKSFIILLILAILATGGVICMNSDIFIQKNYKKPVRFKKLKYRKFNIEDEYIKEIVNSESSAEKKIPYEYKINKKGVLIGSAIGDDGYPLKKYGKGVKEKIASNVKHLSFNGSTLLFLDNKNKLYGMGWNRTEELGIKMNEEEKSSEITGVVRKPVSIIDNVIYMTNQNETGTVLAIKEDKSVWTWGCNGSGLLGYDKDCNKDTVQAKKILDHMRFVTSNWYNAAAISEDNDLYLWGDNAYGQLGNGKKGGEYGMEENYEYIPQKTMSDVAKVKIRKGRIIVIRLDGSKWEAGVGCGSEKGTDGKNISTRFIRIDKK